MSTVHPIKATTLALVGPNQQENLTLGYLAAAVVAAGFQSTHVPFNTKWDQHDCIEQLMRLSPDVVGLSIAFQFTIDDYIDLAAALRKRGYAGHITCGGHVPTFCYEGLLKDVPAIDTVVRHEGEQTLVELLEAIEEGGIPEQIPGLVWRTENGIALASPRPLTRSLDSLPLPKRNVTSMVVGGAPLASVLSSRGCVGDCAYCSIRAFTKDAGGPGYRLRKVSAVADEIAQLYHEKNVRVIILLDDLFVMPSRKKTVAKMQAMTKALKVRGVLQMLFWIKARPETITPEVIQAAKEMGVIHIFLGIESHCESRLKYLGRSHLPAHNTRAISLCLENGIRPSFNFMLFDPDCTLDEVKQSVDFAQEQLMMTWNLCRTEIFPGTHLFKRLRQAGRLMGNYRTYGYQIRDEQAEIMFRILRVGFFERSFNHDSLLNRMISLSFARQVQNEYLKGSVTDAFNRQVDDLIREINTDTVAEIRRIMDFAATAKLEKLDRIRDFSIQSALGVNEKNHYWFSKYEELLFQIEARGARFTLQLTAKA